MTDLTNKIYLISFTKQGYLLSEELAEGFVAMGYETQTAYGGKSEEKVDYKAWTAEHFQQGNVLIFIGAAGIAVRAIAPHLKHKSVDPAVIVLDEKGKHAISLLSGHIGEANAFAKKAADIVDGQSVVTTATDVNGLFAVDVFAKRNGLVITDFKDAKDFAGRILETKKAALVMDSLLDNLVECRGDMPDCLERICEDDETSIEALPTVYISPRLSETRREAKVHLLPTCLVVGIGCRRGKPYEELKAFLEETLAEMGLDKRSISRLCSIDLKKDEEGIKALAEDLHVPFRTYDAETLNRVPGDFTASDFVRQTTGTDNICERSALAGGGEKLILQKKAKDGMTLALALRRVMLYVSNQKTTEDGDKFFSNRSCPYFPCHKGVMEEEFNCLFCYCPLYVLGKDCGGRFVYNSKGRKVCTDCPIPHIKKNHDYVVSRYNEIVERMDRLNKE